eukprot:TRINITY_DN268_c0_g1_i1.p1 TRINITY_DN268_c0_g1~~TRINITY_DN268_c0_g1_i1.p1  ORF type:complete len:305 (-),score=59.61 TRINITY_DN268_c0_g1_i1:1-807(-)
MIARIVMLAAVLAVASAQDSVFIQVNAAGSSEYKVVVKEAVATAIASLNDACENGQDAAVAAEAVALVVVEESVKAVAASLIVARTTGDGVGVGAASVSARSTIEVTARAIAEAIAEVNNGPEVIAATESIVTASETAVAAVQQELAIGGDAEAVAIAAAEAEVFVNAVAVALAAAAAACQDGEAVAAAGTQTAAGQVPAPADTTDTVAVAGVNVGTNGFASIFNNAAVARVFGNLVTPIDGTPAPPTYGSDDGFAIDLIDGFLDLFL